MKNSIWIVLDPHGEQLDLCADELTAYAVKKHWDSAIVQNLNHIFHLISR